jgi:hypothetical protein
MAAATGAVLLPEGALNVRALSMTPTTIEPTPPTPSLAGLGSLQSPARRAVLGAAGGLATMLGWPGLASADSASVLSALASGLRPALPAGKLVDQSVRVSAARLDQLVARTYPDFNNPAVLPAFDPARSGARYDVELHRLVAPFVVPETGEAVTLSGLLALPVGATGPLPIVSWQHGTVLTFDGVPSNMLKLADPNFVMSYPADSAETLFNVHRFAGQGYAVIAADYVGKGPFRNGRGEAYGVRDVTVGTCLRMLEAGYTTLRAMGIEAGPLFLNGWSQGGLNSQWLAQELRRRKIAVAATSVSSPFNELTETLRFWSGAQTYPVPEGAASFPAAPDWLSLCMIVLLGSYELNYGLKGLMQHAVAPPFRDMAANFWRTYDMRFDPAKPFPSGSTLLVPRFFDSFTHETNSAFLRQIARNSATYWHYDSPIRFHIGLADEGIHPTVARRAIAAGGALATEVTVAGASHRATFMASLYGEPRHLAGQTNTLAWFDSLRRG